MSVKEKTVMDYTKEMIERSNLSEEVSSEAELWNILYNLLSDYGVRADTKIEDVKEDVISFIESYESMYYNHFPKKVHL